MTKYEEIYLLNALLSNAKTDNSVDLENTDIWKSLFLSDDTKIQDEYFYELNNKGFLNYEEVGEEGFKPILICSITSSTRIYLKQLIKDIENVNVEKQKQIDHLNKRIIEILTFDPNRLSAEIKSTENIIIQAKQQINSNPILHSLSNQLEQIEMHFNSLSKVANNYEEVYKNIILPVKEEGKSGIRQTVRWAIISIIVSTIISVIITWLTK